MSNQEYIENNTYEILGENGWEDFDGLVVNIGLFHIYEIKTSTHSIKCTDKHKICVNNEMIVAENIVKDDLLHISDNNMERVISNEYIGTEDIVYDIFNSDSHKVYINGILTSNCDELAFVDPQWKAEEFWASNYPTVSSSTTAKIIIISTPNGMFNRFHTLYTGAENKKNTFIHTKYDWRAVPGRDEQWAKEQEQNLGKVKFAQEFSCLYGNNTVTIMDKTTGEIKDMNISELFDIMM